MTKYDIMSSATEPITLRVLPELAEEIGLNTSLVLLQLAFWIRIGKHEHDGQYWTYQSVRDMQKKAFPFWSHMTIQRAIERLIERKLIVTRDDLNRLKQDNTRWFALNPVGFEGLQSVSLAALMPRRAIQRAPDEDGVYQNVTGLYQDVTPLYQDVTTLPETTAENTQEEPTAPLQNSHYNPPPIRVLQNDTLAQVKGYQLVAAYAEATGVIAETIWAAYQNKQVAAGLAKGGITPEDIGAFIQDMRRTQPERYNGYRFHYMAEDLPMWRRNAAAAPVSAAGSFWGRDLTDGE
jgi:hypothetical protein